ncbi:MAG: class I SAM-dependent methyltransferase [Verrucomicrobiales bacterium]|nr:class I SAM-dependent methyltransferase [Verrucomicrobiales bacterium]
MDIQITGVSVAERILPFDELHVPGKPVAVLSPDQKAAVFEFNTKVQNGEIHFESVGCLCGSWKFVLIAGYDRFGMRQSTVMCESCGLVQSNPRMTAEETKRFYSSDTYRRLYNSTDYLEQFEAAYFPKTGKNILEEVAKIKTVNASVSVLEIGAGGGWNLVSFRDAGASVLGVDYSPSLVELGKAHGIAMQQGDADGIQGQYGVIILNHVFEHLLDPLGTLETVKKHLKPDGIVYIGVPNFLNFPLNNLQNAHTYYFDPLTFAHYCLMAGLSCVAHGPSEKYHMFGIFKSSPAASPSSLDGHGRQVLKFLKRVKRRRQLKLWMDSIGIGSAAMKLYRKFVIKMD